MSGEVARYGRAIALHVGVWAAVGFDAHGFACACLAVQLLIYVDAWVAAMARRS